MVSIVGEITRADLEDYGSGVASSVLRVASDGDCIVPSDDHLRIGDVILTRRAKKWPFLPSVETYQRREPRFETGDAATWTHAMLYVGSLHVVESTNFFKLNTLNWTTGIRVVPFVHSDPKVEYVVCRHKQASSIADFGGLMQSAAIYALMDYALKRRTYGFNRATAIVFNNQKIWQKLLSRALPNRFTETVICSEYVLECLAIGAAMFAGDWHSLDGTKFFLPADFYEHPDLDRLEMRFVRLRRDL